MEETINKIEENSLACSNVVCRKCKYELQPEFSYCPMCGNKVESTLSDKQKKTIVISIIITLIAVIGLIFVIYGFTPKSNNTKNLTFEEMFPDYYNEFLCEIADDDSYMTIDTNRYDIDNYSDDEAIDAIEDVNAKLGFSESVFKKMEETRALDGRQQAENENFIVSWTYHPDKGLEVMYERK